jgi:hypothetical protein
MHRSHRFAVIAAIATLTTATTIVAVELGAAGTSAAGDTRAQTPAAPVRTPDTRPAVNLDHPNADAQAHRAAQPAVRVGPRVRIVNVAFNAGADVGRAQADVNACQGPTAVQWGPTPPIIIQHNYCGGWGLVDVHPGDEVRIRGGGAIDGLYRWASARVISGAGPITDIKRSWGDVILQTCLNQTELEVVGLVRVGPAAM